MSQVAQWSDDGKWWWDGAAWRKASDDHQYYWDGNQWHGVPADAMGAFNPDGPGMETATPVLAPLAGEVRQEHGTVGLGQDGSDLVIRTTGKNLITRKQWNKEQQIPLSEASSIMVVSRDRQTFSFDISDEGGRSLIHVAGVPSKAEMDTLVHELTSHHPQMQAFLAHPSQGLPDPAHERAKQERDSAIRFNREEERARNAAAARPEVKVKTYDNAKDYEKDAGHMGRGGWVPEGQAAGRGKVSVGGTATKLVLTAGLGAITGFSRKSDRITVTWVKTPPSHVPNDFLPIPDVPAPRAFPPEPYFSARLTAPVAQGEEFTPPEGATAASSEVNGHVIEQVVPAAEAPSVPAPEHIETAIDRMKRLNELKAANLITEEEYHAKRAEVLSAV